MDAKKILEANIELQNENKYLKIDLERYQKAIKEAVSVLETYKNKLDENFLEEISNILNVDQFL